jgi:hypothetical protein
MAAFIEILNGTHQNVKIYNNTLAAEAITSPLIPFGIAISSIVNNVDIRNNILSGGIDNGILINSNVSGTVTVDYNIFHNTANNHLLWDTRAGGNRYNDCTTLQAAGFGTGYCNTGDPKYTSSSDWSLQSSSPAIDKGVSLSAIFTTDYAGNVRGEVWDVGAYEYDAEPDTTPPTISSATVETDGDTLTIVFDEVVTVNTSTGFTLNLSGGAAGLTYTSGSGTNTLVYAITGRNIDTAETGTLDYATVANGIEDAAGNDLASTGETDEAVTNDSEYTPSATTYIVTIQSSGNCTVSPFTNKVIVSGETASYTCTASGNSGCAAWTGTCGGTGTTSFVSAAVTGNCTVIQGCYKISPDVAIGAGAATALGTGAVGTLY